MAVLLLVSSDCRHWVLPTIGLLWELFGNPLLESLRGTTSYILHIHHCWRIYLISIRIKSCWGKYIFNWNYNIMSENSEGLARLRLFMSKYLLRCRNVVYQTNFNDSSKNIYIESKSDFNNFIVLITSLIIECKLS